MKVTRTVLLDETSNQIRQMFTDQVASGQYAKGSSQFLDFLEKFDNLLLLTAEEAFQLGLKEGAL